MVSLQHFNFKEHKFYKETERWEGFSSQTLLPIWRYEEPLLMDNNKQTNQLYERDYSYPYGLTRPGLLLKGAENFWTLQSI